LVTVLVVAGLFAIYRANTGSATGAASDRYDVGSPGIGAVAPDFLLPNVTAPAALGGTPATTRLSDYRGKTVLLYFHEGLGCQPCWDQIRDLQKDPAALAAMGADQLLTITTGPQYLVAQKMHDDGLTEPALADTGLRVSTQYQANRYGMMGSSSDGHTFVLVGPDGIIRWRADYGGPPRFTMYVTPEQLIADERAARAGS
jgi:peroxiredoxin